MKYPVHLNGGAWNTSHVQGIAVNTAREYFYFSFTTMLVKAAADGRIVGTVCGINGHLGDLDFNDSDGRVWGSLECKKNNAFYIAVFDVSKINRMNMDASSDGIMTVIGLHEVIADFTADMDGDGVFDGDTADTADHRYGCSGIDGVAFGPDFGSAAGSYNYLMVAYGIYGNVNRHDNDYQIILRYDPAEIVKYERIFDPSCVIGPPHPAGKYFLRTGNTVYGVQNLEYDAYSHMWFMAVYRGKKPEFANYPMFYFSGSLEPRRGPVLGQASDEYGIVLPESGICGLEFPYGQTGMAALDDGYFYFSHNSKTEDGKQTSDIYLYKWDGSGFAGAY